jgi:hypothetical protein
MLRDITMKTLLLVHPKTTAAQLFLNLADAALSNLRPSLYTHLHPGFACFLSVMFLAGLSGCGPAASDYPQNLKSHASLGAPSGSPPTSQSTPIPRNNGYPSAAGPTPFAASPASNPAPVAAASIEPAPQPEHLTLPIWMAQALNAPDVSVRLQALDMWAEQGAQASLDPLVVALDDDNDEVREKAMAIIEQNWAQEQEAEPKAGK